MFLPRCFRRRQRLVRVHGFTDSESVRRTGRPDLPVTLEVLEGLPPTDAEIAQRYGPRTRTGTGRIIAKQDRPPMVIDER